jgi:hypothetical protein
MASVTRFTKTGSSVTLSCRAYQLLPLPVFGNEQNTFYFMQATAVGKTEQRLAGNICLQLAIEWT